jgi:(4-(4-[2-(gamma-L-glutamylamino)ethyl]phenoxymethyl)furan-2-yl)methanamine synthase
MRAIIGWDIGGAHLKAARAENGRIVAAVQLASPLRLGLGSVAAALAEAKLRLGGADRHVVTMTAELADTFASRAEGVSAIAATVERELAGRPIRLYAGRAGFIAPTVAGDHVADIASANWHATAALAACRQQAGLVADMGSTTTDLIPVADGRIAAQGYTDAERLASGELVYTGVVRSFLMASARRAPFRGRWCTLINENFAHMADVHRTLDSLPEGVDLMPTADGRGRSVEASCARLARMVGCDLSDADAPAWRALARWFAEQQLRAVTDAAMLVLSQTALPDDAPLITAGAGAVILQEVARRLSRPAVRFESLLDVTAEAREASSHCAPAAALALLAAALPDLDPL